MYFWRLFKYCGFLLIKPHFLTLFVNLAKSDSLHSWSFYLLFQVSFNRNCVTWMSCNQDLRPDFFFVYWVIHSNKMFQTVFLKFTCLCTIDSNIQFCLYNNVNCSDMLCCSNFHICYKKMQKARTSHLLGSVEIQSMQALILEPEFIFFGITIYQLTL